MKNKITQVFLRVHYVIIISLTLIIMTIYTDQFIRIILGSLCGLYILLFEIYFLIQNKDVHKLSRDVVSILNMTSQKRLIDFPIPIIISDSNGEIVWYNEIFIDTVGTEYMKNFNSTYQISEDLLTTRVLKVFFADKHFVSYQDCSILSGRELYIFYLFDISDHHTLIYEYNQTRPVVAHVLIDNYDELFQSAKESEKSSAMALIDEAVNKWAQDSNGILKKIERDRYIFIFEKHDLTVFVEKRFNILDKIRNLTTINRSFPTLSIGIGLSAASFSENEELANQSIELALSRGGDQAVIKTTNGFEFFGGRTNNMEKRTKVKSRVVAQSLTDLLSEAENVVIMGHKQNDLDSFGACIGTYRIAKSLNINAYIVAERQNNLAKLLFEKFDNDPNYTDVFINENQAANLLLQNTLLIILDTHRPEYVQIPKLINIARKIIIIDHHRKSADFIPNSVLFFHEPYVSSTCEMVTELLQYMDNTALTPMEAEALLAGIVLDTKHFTIMTNIQTFEASSFLRKAGANTVNVQLMFQTDMETYMAKVKIINNAKIYKKVIAYSIWDGKTSEFFKISGSQAADELLHIENVQASFTIFYNQDGSVNISARSYGFINVQLVMEKLNGGGHQTMAGTQIRNCTLAEAEKNLLTAIDLYLTEFNINI